jgi:hypothetical protein
MFGPAQPLREAGEHEGCSLVSLLRLEVVACTAIVRRPMFPMSFEQNAEKWI